MISPPGGSLQITNLEDSSCTVVCAGAWSIQQGLPSADEVLGKLKAEEGIKKVSFDCTALAGWDSGLLTTLTKIAALCDSRSIALDTSGLPEGLQRLLSLATAIPERAGARKTAVRDPFLVRVADATFNLQAGAREALSFIGDVTVALGRLLSGKARFRKAELFFLMQSCGAEALPIVSLISLLVGLILAFVGAVQLQMFGAQIYVASLVGIGMVRVMGAIMTGIIMAGRTGAAFAAELGTMQVNEEIDALQTMGISPMEFLVLPRMIALTVMMPLLCIYADLMGILGGLIVGVGMLDLGVMEYYNQTVISLSLTHFWIGLFYSAVFGVLVALCGCLRGMQCGRSASAVGTATTSAVVTSIVCIIVSTAIITVICNVLGI
ncbi:MAG: ABC transporter permease [Proteobacteria bacterium]|nr:ABC transporter permease [Pseudomonadota bacterium]